MIINTTGNNTKAAALKKLCILSRVKPYWSINFATANAVAHLANSAGCTLQKPKLTHEREPLMSLATKGVTSNTNIMAQ